MIKEKTSKTVMYFACQSCNESNYTIKDMKSVEMVIGKYKKGIRQKLHKVQAIISAVYKGKSA